MEKIIEKLKVEAERYKGYAKEHKARGSRESFVSNLHHAYGLEDAIKVLERQSK
jgi:hypothetical protein